MHLFSLLACFKLYLLKNSLAEVHRNHFSHAILKLFLISLMPFLLQLLCILVILFFLATLMIISISSVLKFHDDMFTSHPFSVHHGRHLISLYNLDIYVWGKFSCIISLVKFHFSLFILSLSLLLLM